MNIIIQQEFRIVHLPLSLLSSSSLPSLRDYLVATSSPYHQYLYHARALSLKTVFYSSCHTPFFCFLPLAAGGSGARYRPSETCIHPYAWGDRTYQPCRHQGRKERKENSRKMGGPTLVFHRLELGGVVYCDVVLEMYMVGVTYRHRMPRKHPIRWDRKAV